MMIFHTPQQGARTSTNTSRRQVGVFECKNGKKKKKRFGTFLSCAHSRNVCAHSTHRRNLHVGHHHQDCPGLRRLRSSQPSTWLHGQGAQRQLHQCKHRIISFLGPRSAVGPPIDTCVLFQIMSNQQNLCLGAGGGGGQPGAIVGPAHPARSHRAIYSSGL